MRKMFTTALLHPYSNLVMGLSSYSLAYDWGSLSGDSMAWRGRLAHQFSTVIMDMVGSAFQKKHSGGNQVTI